MSVMPTLGYLEPQGIGFFKGLNVFGFLIKDYILSRVL